jgi:hypothetical protein
MKCCDCENWNWVDYRCYLYRGAIRPPLHKKCNRFQHGSTPDNMQEKRKAMALVHDSDNHEEGKGKP